MLFLAQLNISGHGVVKSKSVVCKTGHSLKRLSANLVRTRKILIELLISKFVAG